MVNVNCFVDINGYCVFLLQRNPCVCVLSCVHVCANVWQVEVSLRALGGGCVEVVHLSLQGPDRNWQKYRREKVIDAEG